MRWQSPDGLSIFWISFQRERAVMTREGETNIIMCFRPPLKMISMTGRASCSHTWPEFQCRHLGVCLVYGHVSLQSKIWCILTPTWHNWQWKKLHAGQKTYRAQTRRSCHGYGSPCWAAKLTEFLRHFTNILSLYIYDIGHLLFIWRE